MNADDDDEESVTIDVAARRLGCDPSTVRSLIQSGQLMGHRVGKGLNPRGIRVHASSIRAYKQHHAIRGTPVMELEWERRPVRTPAAEEAKRRLREMGVLPPEPEVRRKRPKVQAEDAVKYLRKMGSRI